MKLVKKNEPWHKDFNKWNERKKMINDSAKEKDFYFKEREIWWCALGVNIGYEQDGKNDNFERPILILKIFNKEVLWMVPLTSKAQDEKYYYKFKYKDGEYSVILSQVRLISSKRLLRKIGSFPGKDFKKVRELITEFI
jgi:mRNA interferase MazF